MLSIGFRGGVELHKSGINHQITLTLLAAVAATYGSVSAITFIAATSFLSELKVPFGGHMVAAMALMAAHL